LSEITALDHENFLVIERDNQANADAAVKRIYQFSTTGLTPLEDPPVGIVPNFPVVQKILDRDLVKDLAKTRGLILEKIEGMTVTKNGDLYIVNDNDGVDDSNGETQLLKIYAD
jgi:phytase-like protein